MKFKITIDVPEPRDVSGRLDVHAAHPGLAPAELAERRAAQDLEEVRGQHAAAVAHAERVAVEVQFGRLAMQALDDAMRARDALALRLGPAQAALAEATVSRERGHAHACDAVRAEARRFNDALQALADQVAPVLVALRAAEVHLEDQTRRSLEMSVSGSTGLPAVLWPGCLRDDLAEQRWFSKPGA